MQHSLIDGSIAAAASTMNIVIRRHRFHNMLTVMFMLQATMVATWLTELYLDQINRALLEEAPEQPSSPTSHPSQSHSQAVSRDLHASNDALPEDSRPEPGESQLVKALTKRLREFLAKRVEVLDTQVTVTLLASYGRLDDLMHYATLRQVSLRALHLYLHLHDVAAPIAEMLSCIVPCVA